MRHEITELLQFATETRDLIDQQAAQGIEKAMHSMLSDDSSLERLIDSLKKQETSLFDPMIGKTVTHFAIEKRLGAGGMGIVYKAHDIRLDRDVALKFLPVSAHADGEAKSRFIHEAKAASSLDHVNIGAVYDIGETEDSRLFIAMAYYQGETLNQKIEKGPLSQKEALSLIRQVGKGLAKAHEKGITHRDIKPANLLETNDGVVKILDFGIAKLTGGTTLTRPHTAAGTVAYMSPEQTRGEISDTRSDIWSLGITLYELLAGKRPFSGENSESVINAIQRNEPTPLKDLQPDIDDSVVHLVAGCLVKQADKRYQSVTDFLADLELVLEGYAPQNTAVKAMRRAKRRRFMGISLVAGIALVASILYPIYYSTDSVLDSVAVLPFENLSSDSEQDYFVAGIHDGLTTNLARMANLKVIARASAMRFKDSNLKLKQIAKELGVKVLVTGSVLREEDRVRVSIQLVDGRSETNIWAQQFYRDISDILNLQGDIVSNITSQLRTELSPLNEEQLGRKRSVDPQVYEAYVKGRFYLSQKGEKNRELGTALLERAVEMNPNEPLAHVGLAEGYASLGHSLRAPPDIWKKARTAVEKAIELDPNFPEAIAVLARILMYQEKDFERAEELFVKANEMNPNLARNHYHYAWFLVAMGRFEEAYIEHIKAKELDPLTPGHTVHIATLYLCSDRAKEAYKESKRLEGEYSDNAYLLSALGTSAAELGYYEEAIATHEKLAESYPWMKGVLARTYAVAGRETAARELISQIRAKERFRPIDAYYLAATYVALGDFDSAFEWLNREPRSFYIYWMGRSYEFKPILSDPRFQKMAEELNIPYNRDT